MHYKDSAGAKCRARKRGREHEEKRETERGEGLDGQIEEKRPLALAWLDYRLPASGAVRWTASHAFGSTCQCSFVELNDDELNKWWGRFR
eukprot:2274524-Rhodomonas_salina.5